MATEIKHNTITITLPDEMSLVDRISAVSREITEWMKTFEDPFDLSSDILHLVKVEINAKYSYHYMIERAVKDPKKVKAGA